MVAVLLCLVFTKAMFSTYKEEQVMSVDGNIYLLQYGSYINKQVMEENVKKLDDYLVYVNDEKYYVFVGASTFLENAQKLSNLLEEEGIYTYLKNDYISDSKLLDRINLLDKEIVKNNDLIKEKNKEILKLLKDTFS